MLSSLAPQSSKLTLSKVFPSSSKPSRSKLIIYSLFVILFSPLLSFLYSCYHFSIYSFFRRQKRHLEINPSVSSSARCGATKWRLRLNLFELMTYMHHSRRTYRSLFLFISAFHSPFRIQIFILARHGTNVLLFLFPS